MKATAVGTNRFQGAVYHYRTAIALEPTAPFLHYNLGKVT